MKVNDRLQDDAIMEAVRFKKLQNRTYRRLIKSLIETYQEVIGDINNENLTSFQARRLNQLAAGIKDKLQAAYAAMGLELESMLPSMVTDTIATGGSSLDSAVGVAWTSTPSTATTYATAYARPYQGRLLREHFAKLPVTISDLVKRQLRIGYQSGETTTQVVARVNKILKRQGKAWNRTLINTAMTHFRGVAVMSLYKANAGAIRGIKWNATLDTHTTEFCYANDGRVFKIDRVPLYPNHYNERSILTPELLPWDKSGIDVPVGTRSSMDGQISAELNAKQWLEQSSFSRKSEAIGVTKAKMNREGVSIEDMFLKNRMYTLPELKVKFPDQYAAAVAI